MVSFVISDVRLTRFQFARDRVIGDSQVRISDLNALAVELIAADGSVGLGFAQSLFTPFPDLSECKRVFRAEVWPGLEGKHPLALVHRIDRPRGGNQRGPSIGFGEAVQVALWDLAAKQAGLPLWRMLGGQRQKLRAYASGLDFHLSDKDFTELLGGAAAQGFTAFKIKLGHTDFGRDLHRLDLLTQTVGREAQIMVDANEAWGPKEAAMKIEAMRNAGFHPFWVEDPVLRNDIDGLRLLRSGVTGTLINSGEYLDLSGRRALLQAGATDMLNVHGRITEVMQIGWLAAEMGVPVTMGNTFLEIGVHTGVALPEVEWMEYSFQNYDHLVEEPIDIHDGYAHAPDRPGHGLALSDAARNLWSAPVRLAEGSLPAAPGPSQLSNLPKFRARR